MMVIDHVISFVKDYGIEVTDCSYTTSGFYVMRFKRNAERRRWCRLVDSYPYDFFIYPMRRDSQKHMGNLREYFVDYLNEHTPERSEALILQGLTSKAPDVDRRAAARGITF